MPAEEDMRLSPCSSWPYIIFMCSSCIDCTKTALLLLFRLAHDTASTRTLKQRMLANKCMRA